MQRERTVNYYFIFAVIFAVIYSCVESLLTSVNRSLCDVYAHVARIAATCHICRLYSSRLEIVDAFGVP